MLNQLQAVGLQWLLLIVPEGHGCKLALPDVWCNWLMQAAKHQACRSSVPESSICMAPCRNICVLRP